MRSETNSPTSRLVRFPSSSTTTTTSESESTTAESVVSSIFGSARTTSTSATTTRTSSFYATAIAPTKNVASFDGGGVRGIFHALALEELQKHLDSICEERGMARIEVQNVFDEYIGTSAGGLAAAIFGLLRRNPTEAVELFRTLSGTIFRALWINNPWRYAFRCCSSSKTRAAFDSVFAKYGYEKDSMLEDFSGGPLVTLVAVDNEDITRPVFFSNQANAETHPVPITLREAAMATIAAPTYFKPVTHAGRCYVDGGLVANNPSDHARTPAVDTNLFLSIGTGSEPVSWSLVPGRTAHALTSPLRAHTSQRRLFAALGASERYIRIEPPEIVAKTKLNGYQKMDLLIEESRKHLCTPEIVADLRRAAVLIVENRGC